jgi:hypothetical protein
MIRGADRKAETMSQDEFPKPDFDLKIWPLGITARTPLGIYAGLAALAMLLVAYVTLKLSGH